MRRLGRLVDAAPDVGTGLQDGSVGIGQAHVLARAFANPRCGDQVLGQISQLLRHARNESACSVRANRARLDRARRPGRRVRRQRPSSRRPGHELRSQRSRVRAPSVRHRDRRRGAACRRSSGTSMPNGRPSGQHASPSTATTACPARMARTVRATSLRRVHAHDPRRDQGHHRRTSSPEALVNLMIDVTTFEHIADHLLRTEDDSDSEDDVAAGPEPCGRRPRPSERLVRCRAVRHDPTTCGVGARRPPTARSSRPSTSCSKHLRGQIRLVVTDRPRCRAAHGPTKTPVHRRAPRRRHARPRPDVRIPDVTSHPGALAGRSPPTPQPRRRHLHHQRRAHLRQAQPMALPRACHDPPRRRRLLAHVPMPTAPRSPDRAPVSPTPDQRGAGRDTGCR